MLGYTYHHVCLPTELEFFQTATEIVALLPEKEPAIPYDLLRCHEVARVVAHFTGLEVLDGRYGMVDHSWLKLPPIKPGWPTTRVLDPYSVGRLPIVQIVDCDLKLPSRTAYKVEEPRTDIRTEVIEALILCVERGRLAAMAPSEPV